MAWWIPTSWQWLEDLGAAERVSQYRHEYWPEVHQTLNGTRVVYHHHVSCRVKLPGGSIAEEKVSGTGIAVPSILRGVRKYYRGILQEQIRGKYPRDAEDDAVNGGVN